MIIMLRFIVTGTLIVALAGTVVFLFLPGISGPSKLALLPAIAISAGVLIAIVTFDRERETRRKEDIRNESKAFLSSATKAFDTVIDLLKDQNNSRVVWVRAARTLLEAIDLGKQIKDPDYQKVYELEAQQTRNSLYDVLTIESKETGQRMPLPPQFFYGIKGWKDGNKSLDTAAIEASVPMEAYSVDPNRLTPQPHLMPLAIPSVIAIYDFLDYPSDYKDPLDEVKARIPEWGDGCRSRLGFFPDQGARKYVDHAWRHTVSNGEVIEVRPPNASEALEDG